VSTHEGLQELLGAYALDAVDDDEREAVEEHLRACAACRDEVAQHREVAAHLVDGAAAPPQQLWGRIASALHADAPPEGLAPVFPFSARPSRRRAAAALVGAAALVAAALGVLGWQVARQDHQVASLGAAVSSTGLARAASAALADPRARVAVLASPDGRVQVTGVLEPDGTGYLVRATALPALPPGMTYQLWGVVGAQKISLGVIGANPSVVAFHAGPGTSALAVTAEAGGGVVQSTHAPVVAGAVPA
jgi:anti-sigma factor RsiW